MPTWCGSLVCLVSGIRQTYGFVILGVPECAMASPPQAMTAIESAATLVAQAQEITDEKASVFAGLGADAVAQALAGIGEHLAGAAGHLQAGLSMTAEASTALAEVGRPAALSRVLAAVDNAIGRLGDSNNSTVVALGSAQEADAAARQVGVVRVEESAATAVEGIEEAVAVVAAAVTAAGEYRQQIAAGAASAATTATPAAPAPVFKPMRTDPAKRDEIAPYVGLDYAVATLWDSAGNKIVGIHSADDDGPAATAKWRQPWGSMPRLRRHVEPHAAARMKPGENEKLVMYLNMKPCSYPDGCDLNLRDIIPKDAMLIVHWVKPSGTVEVLRYPGTGRGVSDE